MNGNDSQNLAQGQKAQTIGYVSNNFQRDKCECHDCTQERLQMAGLSGGRLTTNIQNV